MKHDTSKALFARAQERIPGGVNSPVRAFRAVGGTPVFFERAEGAWLTDAGERAAVVAAGRETVATLGGALDRTLAAIEPYLMQIRLERRAPDA